MEEKLLRGTEVANVLNVCRSFAYQLMREGKIPVVKMGRAVRVRESDLEDFIFRSTQSISTGQFSTGQDELEGQP